MVTLMNLIQVIWYSSFRQEKPTLPPTRSRASSIVTFMPLSTRTAAHWRPKSMGISVTSSVLSTCMLYLILLPRLYRHEGFGPWERFAESCWGWLHSYAFVYCADSLIDLAPSATSVPAHCLCTNVELYLPWQLKEWQKWQCLLFEIISREKK